MEQNRLTGSPHPQPLADALRAQIHLHGPLPFSRFMEEALYHPQWGYYSPSARPIGRRGDFFTSVSVGRVYGELLAGVLFGLWRALGQPPHWIIAEQGGHDGQLAADILTTLHAFHPEAATTARWRIIESRPPWRALQEQTLTSAGLAQHLDPSTDPSPGVLLSNELVDALPVDVLVRRGATWMEKRVGLDAAGDFTWTEVPTTSDLAAAARRRALPEIEGYTAEIPRAAEAWAAAWHHIITHGFTLTVDYGDAGPAQHTPARATGTLRAYHHHRLLPNVLENPGSRDITAQVDFSALARAAAPHGWTVAGWCDQHHFLTSAAIDTGWLARLEHQLAAQPADPAAHQALRQFQTLSHPGMMGCAFHTLLMARGLAPDAATLPGFRFSRPFPAPDCP